MAMTFREVIKEIPTVLKDMVANHISKYFKVIAPSVLQVNVTMRCNAKCAMCNIWKFKSPHQLKLVQFDKIFRDPVYSSVEYVVLAGGEPTLRDDLPDIVELMHNYMPRLKKLMISSNGINRTSIKKQYPRIAHYCSRHKTRLSLGVSVDGIGEAHDKVRGVKGAFNRAMESVEFLQQLQKEVPFNLSIDPTIFSMNVHEIQKLKDLADRLNLPINYQFAAMADNYYQNAELEQALKIDQEGRESVVEFLQRHIAELTLFDALAYYYAEVIEQTQGALTRSLPCPFSDQGLLLNPDGSLHYCHNSCTLGNALEISSSKLYYAKENLAYRHRLWNERCPSCRISCMFFVSLRKDIFPFIFFLLKRLIGVNRLHGRKFSQTKKLHVQKQGTRIVQTTKVPIQHEE